MRIREAEWLGSATSTPQPTTTLGRHIDTSWRGVHSHHWRGWVCVSTPTAPPPPRAAERGLYCGLSPCGPCGLYCGLDLRYGAIVHGGRLAVLLWKVQPHLPVSGDTVQADPGSFPTAT